MSEYIYKDGKVYKKKKKKQETDAPLLRYENGKLYKNKNADFTEIDIAPVRTTASTQKKKEYGDDGWFTKGAFRDDKGTAFTDTLLTVGATIGDAGLNIAKGILAPIEGLKDLAQYGVAGVSDLIGEDEYAEKVRKNARKESVENLFAPMQDGLLQYSALGDKSRSVASGVGQVGAIIGTAGLGTLGGLGAVGTTALTTGVTGLSSMGSGMSEAYNEGASDEDALTYGAIQGLVDAGTEMIFGGLGKSVKALGLSKGLSSADDLLAKKISSKLSNQITKNFAEYGIKAGAEGFEEVLAGVGSALGKKVTYKSEEEIKTLIEDEDLLDQFLVGAITSGIAQSGYVPKMQQGSLREANKSGRDFITGFTQNEQKVIDKEFENRIKEQEVGDKKLTEREKTKIYDEVLRTFERGEIDTDTIDQVLNEEGKNAYDNLVKESEEFDTLFKTKKADLSREQELRLEELEKKNATKSYKDQLAESRQKYIDDARAKVTSNDRYIVESYNERAKRGQDFEADLTKYDSKQAKTIKRAMDSGILNNTRKTHDFVDMVAKVSAEKGVSFDFLNNQRLRESGFAIEGKTINGFKKGNTITVNMEARNNLNTVVGHEITHVLEGDPELYKALAEGVKAFGDAKGIYQEMYDTAFENYKNVYKDMSEEEYAQAIEKEVTADIVGEYIFSDIDFVRNLSTQNRNVFQKVYNEIKYFLKTVTAGSDAEKQLLKAKKIFEDVYREVDSANNVDTDVKFSLVGNENGIEVYETSEDVKKLSYSQRKAKLLDIMINEYAGRTAKFTKNGESYYALYDKSGVKKGVHGDLKSDKKGYKAKINIGADGNYIELAENSLYKSSSVEQGKENAFHKDAKSWDYYVKTIKSDGNYFDVLINVKDTGNDHYVYDVTLKEATLLPDQLRSYDGSSIASNESVSQNSEKVNTEVQFSMSQDTEGKQLTPSQAEYFKDSKVRDENGFLKVMYHGSPAQFTVFDKKKAKSSGYYGRGFYFSDSESHAGQYGSKYEVYLDIKNPIKDGTKSITREQLRNFVNEIAENEDYGIENYGYGATVDSVTDDVYGKDDFAMLMDLNATSIGDMVEAIQLFNEVNGTNYDGIIASTETVAFYPEQIKNTTNENPTSNEDIRFSLSESVEQGRELVAVHNLSPDKLVKTLKLGAFPMPSIAVTKASLGHSDFGDISLVFGKDTIDPQFIRSNKVYSGDAWTPTYPTISYKLNEKVQSNIQKKINSLVAQNIQRQLGGLHLDSDNMSDTLQRNSGDMVRAFSRNNAMKYVYLVDSKKSPKLPQKEERLNNTFENDFVIQVAEKYGIDALQDYVHNGFSDRQEKIAEIMEMANQYALDKYGANEKLKNFFLKSPMYTNENFGFAQVDNILMSARKYLLNGMGTEIDRASSSKLIEESTNQEEYEAWLNDLFSGIVEKTGIRNDKDMFTPSGNRRKWESLHYEETLENVIRAMKEEGTKGIGMGNGNIFGASTTEFSSIDDIREAGKSIQKLSQEEHDEIKDGFQNRFFELAKSIPKSNSWTALDDATNMLVEAVTKYNTRSGIANYLKRESKGWANYTDSVTDELIALVQDIRNMPTSYFEAKPQRAVGFDEVEAVIVPNNIDSNLLQELTSRGLNVIEYEAGNDTDRATKLNELDDLKFSLSDKNQEFAPTPNGIYSKDVLLQSSDTQETPLYDARPRMGVVEGQQSMFKEPEAPKKITRSGLHSGIMNNIKETFKQKGFDFDNVLKKAKNLSTFSTVDNTPQRVMEKALGYKEGQVLSDLTVNKVAQNETEGIKWLNSFTDRKNGLLKQLSKQYNIKSGSKESAAAQMFAEGFYVNEDNEIIQYGEKELAIDFPDARVRENIKGLANDPRIRQIYDDTLKMINESRTRNAYPEIPRLDNYFLHFRAMDDTFSKLGLPFNPNDIRAKDLPTDLNGVTADLKPGQPYFASAMHRTGQRTSFDLLGGLERYLTSAKNQIYHIDDIQTLRALRNYIADTYGQAHGLENLDSLSEEEVQDRIERVYSSHLSTFAKFLNEEANILAGKTALVDRGLEGIIGRRGITFLDTVNRQVGSNMVGFNVSSSLTNILPVVQTFAKSNKGAFVKAFAQTVSNKVGSVFGRNDGFAEQSPVMIRRKGADRFYRTPFQKVGDTGYALMSAIDSISTELIARTKYNELTSKGMDSQKAHFETDKWVSRLMGDRSLGQMPQLYNSKMLGLITKFQLEVRNQLDSQFYDTIQETKVSNEHIQSKLERNARMSAKVTYTFVQLAVAQHLFGKAFETVAGYNPAFDIIGVMLTALGFDDEEDSEDTALDNVEQGFLALLEDLPYTSTFTGGRIPISSALPIEELVTGKDEYGNDKSRLKTLREVAPYYALPTGYGQIKKTVKGLGMFDDDLPVSGSYTDSGNLRFPVEDTLGNRIKAGLFGQYANDNAREYFDRGLAPLKEKQIQEYKELDLPISEYWDYREGLKKQEELEDKFEYINDLDVTTEQKNIMINNVVDRKEEIDMSNYDDFANFEEFDWYTKNTEKYNFLQENGVSYEEYKADEDMKKQYDSDWSIYKNNPEKVAMSKAISNNFLEYRNYMRELDEIRADKDSNGKSISGSAKAKKQAYIESLDLDYGQKIILHRSLYDSKTDKSRYNREIVEYLDSREDITWNEMVTILEELDFKVYEDGRITW